MNNNFSANIIIRMAKRQHSLSVLRSFVVIVKYTSFGCDAESMNNYSIVQTNKQHTDVLTEESRGLRIMHCIHNTEIAR